ncbi:MAG: GTP-binding protein [Anaerolineales bacterium]|nr:GTP-binding protein [Anaerolineales bacterium]
MLPPEIGQLSNLTELDLNWNELTSLPPQLGQLSNLKTLIVSHNKLFTLPPEIGQISDLRTLIISYNKLTVLPIEVSQLSKLTTLNLNGNRLTTLPYAINRLSNLVRLNLADNQLTELPPEIGQLSNLAELDLSYTASVALLLQILQLPNLQWLDLSHSKLTMLPPQIGQLANLRTLIINHNNLTALPPQIGQLFNLKGLVLRHNRLTTLPPEIGQLSNIKTLIVSNNLLSRLPAQISQLTNLKRLDLTSNSLPVPPEILEKIDDPAIILNYYSQHQTGQRKPLNEAKLLLVGQGSVGKTSLVQRLVENRFNPAENKTEGIDIHQWFLNINGQKVQLNVWDFGGQEIMHATHQFFLTKRSLYLLVLDARLGEEENRLEYWLKLIGSFGGESPVIVVGNKIDQQPLDLDKRGLMLKYPQIRAIVETSCLDGRGLAELQAAIEREVANLPHLNDPLLQIWFNVKTKLEQMDRDYLPYHEYLNLCQTEGVGDDLSQRTLIGFLHDLGVVLNFQDDPRLEETNILNPEWVTSGVYKILNDDTLLTQHHGVLERVMLNRILDPHRYPRDKHLFIMDMMRKFELCFDFEGFADRKFLIPDLLPKEEPDTGDWSKALAFQYHYSILPSSVISRFIVRMNHLIHRNIYWRNGVVLVHEGNTALIKADREDLKIYIWVGGPESGRRRFLAIIRAEFEAIHRTIPGLEVGEKVPLLDHPEVVVDYQHLRDLEEMGEISFVPPGLKQKVYVRELLDSVRPTGQFSSGVVRRFLNEAFSDEDLKVLCYDHFRSVYDEFGSQMSRQEKIQRLIEHCEKHGQIEDLLTHLKENNPAQYHRFIRSENWS